MRIHLTNQLRVRKLALNDYHDRFERMAREAEHRKEALHHIDQDVRRVEGELRQVEEKAQKQEAESKLAVGGMREKDMEMKKRAEWSTKVERGVSEQSALIAQKEKRKIEIKERNRVLMRKKEELRHAVEMLHVSARSRATHQHDKELGKVRESQAVTRIKRELDHKHELNRTHHQATTDRDIARLDNELRNAEERIRHYEADVRQMEADARHDADTERTQTAELRKVEKEMHDLSDESVKVDREIDHIKEEMAVQSGTLAEYRGESKDLLQGKEELRRKYELEHFSANAQLLVAKEKQMQVDRFRAEFARKEAEDKEAQLEEHRMRREMLFLEQEISTIEAELRHLNLTPIATPQSPSGETNTPPTSEV